MPTVVRSSLLLNTLCKCASTAAAGVASRSNAARQTHGVRRGRPFGTPDAGLILAFIISMTMENERWALRCCFLVTNGYPGWRARQQGCCYRER